MNTILAIKFNQPGSTGTTQLDTQIALETEFCNLSRGFTSEESSGRTKWVTPEYKPTYLRSL